MFVPIWIYQRILSDPDQEMVRMFGSSLKSRIRQLEVESSCSNASVAHLVCLLSTKKFRLTVCFRTKIRRAERVLGISLLCLYKKHPLHRTIPFFLILKI